MNRFLIDSTQLGNAGINYMRIAPVQALADALRNPEAKVHTEVIDWGVHGYRIQVVVNATLGVNCPNFPHVGGIPCQYCD